MTKTARQIVKSKTVKKTATKKPIAKKAAGKKAAPKKTAAKTTVRTPKSAANKPAAKKTPVKKSAPKATKAKAASTKTASPKTASSVPPAIKAMAKAVEKALDMNKAKEIVAVDLSRKSALADYMIVASGTSSRQVAALARYAEEALLKNGAKRCRIEGLPQGDWVIVDSGDVVVHLFRPEVREFYQLERLWTDEGEAHSRRNLA